MRLETVWDDDKQFHDVAKCRAEVAKKLLLECQTNRGHNTLIRAGYGGWLLYTAASAGDEDFVRDVLDRDHLLVFGEGEYGVTDILYAAARSKNSKVFRLILDSALLPGGDRRSIGEIEETECEGYSEFQIEIMNRAVHSAARGGNLEFLKEILEDCSDVLVYRDAQGSTILHTASGRGQIEVVKYLLGSYEIIDKKDDQGNTPLHVSAYRGHLAVVEILLSASPSLAQETNDYGDTFLHMAIAGFRAPGFCRLDQHTVLMKMLLCGKFVNLHDIINASNDDGRTVLHMAVTENVQSDLVELLMTAPSINLNIRDAEGNTPLDLLKQRPRSASSEILIKQLIAAGGIFNCNDHPTRSAIASHLKMQGTVGSPGTSFRIPDAEIVLYTGIDNESDGSCEITSTRFTSCSGQLSMCGSGPPSIDVRKSQSVNKTARRLIMLLHWNKKKERKRSTAYDIGDDNSLASYSISTQLENNPIPLRQRFSKLSSSLPNNKRLSVLANLPSPSSKKKFAAGLMQGVIQLNPQASFASPSSSLSGSSWASPMSVRKENYEEYGNGGAEPAGLSHSNRGSSKMKQKHSSFKSINKFLCFGAQGLAVEDSIKCRQQNIS
ncbi:hypothetical protein Leryth_007113 [Lithospermum erythrorhizon]|nr:hypothetical protein Leryth_007113 [Lithospermum erythrorhizon]